MNRHQKMLKMFDVKFRRFEHEVNELHKIHPTQNFRLILSFASQIRLAPQMYT